jgi:hypothetical protein
MNITTRPAHNFVELTAKSGGATITTCHYKNDKDIESIIGDLLDAAYDLTAFQDKTIQEYVEERFGELIR